MVIKSIGSTSLNGGRAQNQDALHYQTLPNGAVALIVCDGMGGLDAGQLASQLVVDTIRDFFDAHYQEYSPKELIINAVDAAYAAITAVSQERGFNLGTTLALMLLDSRTATILTIGDTRIYQFRSRKVIFMSRDHSRVREYIDAGLITEEQARIHPEANRLTMALSPHKYEQAVQPIELPFRAKDLFLLCTDGVWNALPADQLHKLIYTQPNAGMLVPWLLHKLDDLGHARGGGHDNLSAIALVIARNSSLSAQSRAQLQPWQTLLLLLGLIAAAIAGWSFAELSIRQQHTQKLEKQLDSLTLITNSLNENIDSLGRLVDSFRHLPAVTAPPIARPSDISSPDSVALNGPETENPDSNQTSTYNK